jgi:hypothetical protein
VNHMSMMSDALNRIDYYNRTGEVMPEIELTHAEKQLILYVKGHFLETDLITDLKVITGKQCGLSFEHVDPHNIYHFVVKLFLKLEEKDYIKPGLEDFILKLFSQTDEKIGYIDMIQKMLSEITITEVIGMNLGKPDYTLLENPAKENKKA